MGAEASVVIKQAQGWFEAAWIEWALDNSASSYNVYVAPNGSESWTKLDNELVRRYSDFGRADALGLKAGTYQLKVVPVNGAGTEVVADAAVAADLEVRAHDRTGFAHQGRTNGIGAYNDDGTLKEGAIVLYVTANNAKTITIDLQYDATRTKTYTGFQNIIDGYRKCLAQGTKLPAMCIRMIGMIKDSDMDKFLSGEGLAIKGETEYSEMPLTLEGVGFDATMWGFGIQVSQTVGVEIRNFAIMLCLDDCISVATYNSHLWVHNMDLFYGKVGSDADQVKGDGTIDIKLSQYCTVSYNHLFDCGKCFLVDASSQSSNWADNLTYHHNWFDHSDQRHPRLRNGSSFHVYNNYYDGNALYGVGLACGSSALVENNYFRNCQYPVIASAQGTDKNLVNSKISKKGLLSGEEGGIAKWIGNKVIYPNSLITQNNMTSTSFDVYEVSSRDEQIPATVKTLKGSTPYSNFDTKSTMYASTPDAAEDVPTIVMGTYGAGRCQHGDFKWQFDNAKQDENEEVIAELKSTVTSYLSTLVGFFGSNIKNGGGTLINGGDAEKHENYVPSYITPSAVHTVKSASPSDATVKKYFVNGRLIIDNNGMQFNPLGQRQ